MAGKNVFADGSNVYTKNNSTEFQVMSSTGALYHQGTILPNTTLLNPIKLFTWPSTVATTIVDTTTTQELVNKTVNNITITDPTSDAAGTLTIADGGTLATAGAFQHKFTSTADSAVTLPGATDGVLMWTTELDGKITAKTTQINVLGVVTWPTTVAQTLVNTTDAQTLANKTLGAGTISNLETATSDSTLVNYGISVLPYTTDGATVTLAAPVAGAQKFLVVNTTAVPDTTGIFTAVYAGSTATFFRNNSTTYAEYLYVGIGPPHSVLHLIGVSTAQWLTVSAYGNVKYSTQAVFST